MAETYATEKETIISAQDASWHLDLSLKQDGKEEKLRKRETKGSIDKKYIVNIALKQNLWPPKASRSDSTSCCNLVETPPASMKQDQRVRWQASKEQSNNKVKGPGKPGKIERLSTNILWRRNTSLVWTSYCLHQRE